MSDDQRRDPRIATRQRLWCEGQESGTAAETRDVSRNGMFIVADDAPEVGSQLKVTLEDEGGEVTLNMEVMWRGPKTADNKTGVGMRIVGFDKGGDVYERFIGRHLKASSGGEKTRASLRPSVAPPLAAQGGEPAARPTLRPSVPITSESQIPKRG